MAEETNEETAYHVEPEELDADRAAQVRDEVGDEAIVEMLRKMVLIRRFEEHAGRSYQRQKVKGFCHLYSGQEAIAVGAVEARSDDDLIVGHYRDHGHALAVGMEPKVVMSELFGKETGCAGGKGGSMHLYDVEKNFMGGWGIVGGQVPLGGGMAFALDYRGDEACCLAFLGDGAIHQGVVHETLNMAKVWGLPLVVIVENNQYGMGTAVERVSSTPNLEKKAESHQVFNKTVDGQDVFQVYDAVKQARQRAIEDGEPSWLHLKTYRYYGHSMTDPATYRGKDEVEEERDLRDPIVRLRNWVIDEGIVDQDEIDSVDDEMDDIVKEALDFADDADFPDASELTTNVYADWPAGID